MVMIRRNIALETRLIDDLLDVSRIVNGKLALHIRSIDLNEKLKHVAHICREQILEKGIHLLLVARSAISVRLPPIPRASSRYLWNVLKNAAKFTPGWRRYIRRHFTLLPNDVAQVDGPR